MKRRITSGTIYILDSLNTMRNKFFALLLALSFVLPSSVFAQESAVSFGADLVSRYVVRGLDFGDSPSIQPAFSVGFAGFSFGGWASYAISPASNGSDEFDLSLSYGLETGAGTFGVIVTDYYFPNGGAKYFNFDNGSGAHTVEAGITYAGSESFPISLFAGYNFHNDPENSIYVQLGYDISVAEVGFSFFAATASGSSAWYAVESDGFVIQNIGVTASKGIQITESFALPINASFVINPNLEKTYLVFGISL